MSTLPLFGRAFIAARREIPPRQWVIRIMVGIVTGTLNHVLTLTQGQAFPWIPICVGISACLVIWLGEILWVMITRLPLRLQGEVELLRQTQARQEEIMRMEMVSRLRCEYQMDHPEAPRDGVPRAWLTSRLFRLGENWDPEKYAQMSGVGIK
jgi:hypothetical protein